MPKRNVMFSRPEEPAFLKRMKQEIGYKETYDVNTKFESLPAGTDDLSDNDDEPQVVVVNPGDMTKEEADLQKAKLEKENEEKKADLTERVIFKSSKVSTTKDKTEKQERKPDQKKPILSFQDEDDYSEDEEG